MNTEKRCANCFLLLGGNLNIFIVYFVNIKSTICWIFGRIFFVIFLSIQLHLLLVPNLHFHLLRAEHTIAWQQREPTNLAQCKFVFALNLTKLIKLNTRVHRQTCTNNDKRQTKPTKLQSCPQRLLCLLAKFKFAKAHTHTHPYTHTHTHTHRDDSCAGGIA